MFTELTVAVIQLLPLASPAPDLVAQARVDSAHREVVVTVSGLDIPASTGYAHHGGEQRVTVLWPVGGWVRGYHIELVNAAGGPLPRAMLHHAGVVNPARRQLPYPMVERLVAAGRETEPVLLPSSMGVPLPANQPLVVYFALVNPTEQPVIGAELRISFAWVPADAKQRPRDAMPLYLDANPRLGGTRSFDLPPGRSTTSSEFILPVGGRARALGGHLHDYAVQIRLEDVESRRVIARLKARRDREGRLLSVETSRFVLHPGGLRLHANRRYRVVAVYDNPTCAVIRGGAMAFMAGPFIPDDMARWPRLDATDPLYVQDQKLLGHRGADDIPPPHASEDSHAGHVEHRDTGVDAGESPYAAPAAGSGCATKP